MVTAASYVGVEGRHAIYRVTLRPWLWLLTQSSDYKVWQNLSIPDILNAVLSTLPYPVAVTVGAGCVAGAVGMGLAIDNMGTGLRNIGRREGSQHDTLLRQGLHATGMPEVAVNTIDLTLNVVAPAKAAASTMSVASRYAMAPVLGTVNAEAAVVGHTTVGRWMSATELSCPHAVRTIPTLKSP